ncbi:tripartite tricarboxylate transporter substrate binding protein [Halomonas sp. McH1-25]|uniref:Bug family tripartite tricarboxylate transporter substrate binding protein n=2 Tax=Halomonas TaxID=2745 RepID=UPI001EF5B17C|nr:MULTISPECIES: tripartite tricarboxylate transporter substrate-binding protein [unclassified Halomonas]MCG7598285.1 tripartite tricarboxylate transporter substrate binding protein [Halomonas sp. McH1-25]MCP1340932.1 tripartite tricarboxylate transporter substrate-binding protein [Halomonas sp. FL8]MCP1364729.1 tripartite tricarboxylate transporter substrate-binding protein [Halomonas sp. BBD48]
MKRKSTALLTAAGLALTFASSAMSFELNGKVDCIAPSDPGGGWDFTCRSVGRILQELDMVPQAVQTINMPGATGGVAYAHVISKRPADEQLLVAASTVTSAGLAQGLFQGMTADQVNWVAALGADYGVIAVPKDSEFKTLDDLTKALNEDPRSVIFAGGDAKRSWDHLKVLMFADKAGVEDLSQVRYLAYEGGGEALTQVVGGHVDVFSGDISEAKGFRESGDLRILALLSDERLEGDLADIPTAKEQGIDVLAPNWRGFYIPPNVSDDAKQFWTSTIQELSQSDEWKQAMESNGLMPFNMRGQEFEQFVLDQVKDIEDLSQRMGAG